MRHVVIEHHHDVNAGLYRLVVGVPIVEEQEGEDGPVEALVGYGDVRDIVFDADDPRWLTKAKKRRDPEAVAREQRKAVRETLEAEERKRRRSAEDEAAGRQALPGVGSPLAD